MNKRLFLFVLLICSLSAVSANEIQELNKRGEEAQNVGDYYSAIEYYKTAIDLNPAYLSPLRGISESYFILGEYSEALRYVTEALRFASSDLELVNLEGRILLGLGQIEEAHARFALVLSKEPNNINAQFGMAEREIAEGKIQNAAARYREALRISPENRRALLSLVLLYDEIGNENAANYYIMQALYFYSDIPQVRWIAARHFLNKGDFDSAWEHANVAFDLDSEYLEAGLILSELSFIRNEIPKSIDVLESLLKSHRNSPLLWYQLGISYRTLGEIEPSLHALATALAMRSGDDAVRISLENTLLMKTPLGDPRRDRYAQYHFELGKEYENRNLMEKAAKEYRRGLQLNPYSTLGREKLAEYFQHKDYLGRYKEELMMLTQENEANTNLSDNLELLENQMVERVAYEWTIDQFTLPRQEYTLAVFTLDNETFHVGITEDMLDYYVNSLEGESNISVRIHEDDISGYAEAFRRARELQVDYFLITTISESERIFSLQNNIYASKTGGLLTSWPIFRTGNHRIPEAFRKAVDDVQNLLVPYGKLLERDFNKGIVDLGLMDGIEEGNIYQIIRSGEWALAQDSFGFYFSEESVVGTFTVTKTDDLICEGIIQKEGFFDMINQGDIVVPMVEKEESDDTIATPILPPDIYDTLLKLTY